VVVIMFRSILACAAAVPLLAGCGPEVSAGGAAPAEAAAPNVQLASDAGTPATAQPAMATQAEELSRAEAVGVVYGAVLFSDRDAQVGPRNAGVIRSVEVELGDVVRAGQVLARLDDARQQARVESALATRDLSQLEFARIDSLLQRGFVTRQQHDEAHYGLRVAEARLREAEVELEHMRIVAPFNGVITRRVAGPGRTTEEGDSLFRVTALTPLRALARVPERDAAQIRRGSSAIVTAETGVQVEAVVSRIAPAVDPGSGTVEVLLDIARPASLRPGAAATVRFASVSSRF
jgi:membrane fusion protein, multidrug efflux system